MNRLSRFTSFSPTSAILGDSDAYGYIFDNDNPYSLPSDSFARYQWYLYPTTGINVFPVWTDYTGAGVRVAVFDQGIDPTHPDLNGNLLTALGRNASNLSAGGSPVLSTDKHGTAVAGTIAAEKDGDGIVGVAYGANLVSIYSPLTFGAMTSEIPNAYSYAANFDVLNDSWGFANGFAGGTTWSFYDNFLSPAYSAAGMALANLASSGRHGLGTVVVQSAGNSFNVGDDTDLHNFQNSQYIITVAATDYFGNVTSYSSPGASVLVAAPGGGGTDWASEIITTDRVGTAGFHPTDYTFIQGTSFSAPIVSGIVALLLDVNPNLGYRDVQEILAYSAREISSTNNDWRYNGASNWNGGGLHYDAVDHNLGYGLVDALAAVRLAETWSSVAHTASNRQQITSTHSPALVIPDNTGSTAYDYIAVSQSIDVERVEVTLNVTHPFIGDLSVLLTSPGGTASFLLWRPQQNSLSAFGTSQDNIHFTFDTVLDWGENSAGTWQIGIRDRATGDIGKLDSWTLNLIGKPASADDTYIYTNEFSEATADQAARSILSDTGGTDTLNAAACTANLVLNLVPGGVSTIDGRSLTIAAGTIIENAYGGDGNDVITGNSSGNVLSGMRGDDRIDGGAGVDTASYSGVFSSYGIAWVTGGVTISSTADGVDTLQNVEFAKFSDRTISLTPPIFGGTGNDVLTGGFGNDNISGGDGSDWLYGGGGSDTINGDAGNDYLYGQAANDVLDGGDGADIVSGGDGNDTVSGGNGDDGMYGDAGVDTMNGNGGGDFMAGGDDNDIQHGDDGQDWIYGEWGDDTVYGDAGNDFLFGNFGNDTLIGGLGNDLLYGGEGGDTFVFTANQGEDFIVDFSVAQGDHISIASGANGITTAAQALAHVRDSGANAVVELGSGSYVMLMGVATSALHVTDFVIG